MEKKPSKKAVLFCIILVFTAALLFFAAGSWQGRIYNDLKTNCTAAVTGEVVNKTQSRRRTEDFGKPEKRYLTGKHWIHIKVNVDGIFKLGDIYADPQGEEINDEISIRYDPDKPEQYYIGERINNYKTAEKFAYGASVLMAALAAFLFFRFY